MARGTPNLLATGPWAKSGGPRTADHHPQLWACTIWGNHPFPSRGPGGPPPTPGEGGGYPGGGEPNPTTVMGPGGLGRGKWFYLVGGSIFLSTAQGIWVGGGPERPGRNRGGQGGPFPFRRPWGGARGGPWGNWRPHRESVFMLCRPRQGRFLRGNRGGLVWAQGLGGRPGVLFGGGPWGRCRPRSPGLVGFISAKSFSGGGPFSRNTLMAVVGRARAYRHSEREKGRRGPRRAFHLYGGTRGQLAFAGE